MRDAKRKKYQNSKTGQQLSEKTGRFLPKAGIATAKPAISVTGDLKEHLRQHLDLARLARRIAKAAYAGDPASMALLLQATPVATAAEHDFKNLSMPKLEVLADLLNLTKGQEAPSLLAHLKTLIDEIEPLDIEEVETEEPEEIETIADIPPRVEPPKPAEQGVPKPEARPESLTRGLSRRSWLYGCDPDPFRGSRDLDEDDRVN